MPPHTSGWVCLPIGCSIGSARFSLKLRWVRAATARPILKRSLVPVFGLGIGVKARRRRGKTLFVGHFDDPCPFGLAQGARRNRAVRVRPAPASDRRRSSAAACVPRCHPEYRPGQARWPSIGGAFPSPTGFIYPRTGPTIRSAGRSSACLMTSASRPGLRSPCSKCAKRWGDTFCVKIRFGDVVVR
jgi:hypothetical protein